MKRSPLIDFSFSAISTAVVAVLIIYKPEGYELYSSVVPISLGAILVVLKYIAAWLQISNYETFSAVRKLKARQKHLRACLDDRHLSEEALQRHRQEYEKVTSAIDRCLAN